jgi:parallel beta-helix repeat protein
VPIEDADKVHSKRGADQASITIFGRKIGFMKLMTIAGVGVAAIFILIAGIMMMTPPPAVVNITPTPTPIIITNESNMAFSVIKTNYGYNVIQLSYKGNKPISNFPNELLLSMNPPQSQSYAQRQTIKYDSDILYFNDQYNNLYIYTGLDNAFHISYTSPKYSDCADFINGDWSLNIDNNITKRNNYKFNFNIANSRTKILENNISINDSIQNSQDYSTFFIYPGRYKEKIIVANSIRLIGINNPIVDSGGFGAVITLRSKNNVISGLTIMNSGNRDYFDGGIVILPGSTGNIITKNNIYKNIYGVWMYKSDSNTVINNTIMDNDRVGIMVMDSSSNSITNNIVYSNIDGIRLNSGSDFNTITDNNVYDNKGYGIIIENYQVSENTCEYNAFNNNKMSCTDSIDRDHPINTTISTSATITPSTTNNDWWADCKGDPKCYQS